MKTYYVKLIYQNIESGGSTRYGFARTVKAINEAAALQEGLRQLGCNRDGKLYSATVLRQ